MDVPRSRPSGIADAFQTKETRLSRASMIHRRVGLWLIGACGGVGTTAALGLAAQRRGLADQTSMVTALPLFTGLNLDAADAFAVGGHDVRRTNFVESARELHQRANVF